MVAVGRPLVAYQAAWVRLDAYVVDDAGAAAVDHVDGDQQALTWALADDLDAVAVGGVVDVDLDGGRVVAGPCLLQLALLADDVAMDDVEMVADGQAFAWLAAGAHYAPTFYRPLSGPAVAAADVAT